MGENTFEFKQFAIYQKRSAMKVGTDGVLVGAWAPVDGARRVLDVGAGTGLISLMIAQRAPEAHVVGVEIDMAASEEAHINVLASPWADRVAIMCADVMDVREILGEQDLIISNPPFFTTGLAAPDCRRNAARHEGTLTIETLVQLAAWLLAPDGRMAFIAPADREADIDTMVTMARLCVERLTTVITAPGKPPRRQLWLVGRRPVMTRRDSLLIGSPAYQDLVAPFYIR